ncbi:mitochondrial carrier domain-containing protein [Xylariaceae sp. FL0255]|nr:mitochondrial carrier domain-containing protein [Xylariaceae sp. FL0255]
MPSSSSSPSPHSVLPALHHALSGSLGTLISTCALYPLSLVITRLQVQRQLRRDQGPADPSSPTHTSRPHTAHAPHAPITSTAADQDHQDQADTPTADAATASPSTRDTRDRQQPQEDGQQQYAGLADAFSQIWRSDGGPRAFYTGLAGDAVKSVLDSFLFFLFYEWFRAMRLRSRRRRTGYGKSRNLGVVEELAVGMAAGACSRALTTPMSNIVTRKQTATLVNGNNSSDGDGTAAGGDAGVRDIIRSIRKEKGLAGLWSGYSATLVLTLNPSLTFLLHEFLKGRFADQTYDDPGPRLTFLFAATSKAVSSFITYPFQIAKTRLQSGIPLESDDEKAKESTPAGEENLIDFEEKQPGKNEEDKDQDVHKQVEKKLNSLRAVQRLARRSIFGTIAEIIRTEGVVSLYDGVAAELLKGFFSHGTTMLAKDVVHKLLFKLYLVAIGVMAELRHRRQLSKQSSLPQTWGSANMTTETSMPRALQYRVTKEAASSDRKNLDFVVNVVANLIDGSQRPFKGN